MGLFLGCLLAAPARAEEAPAPLAAWREAPSRRWTSLREPVQLSVDDNAAVRRASRELAEAGDWKPLLRLLLQRSRDVKLRAQPVRAWGPDGVLLGTWEDARRRLRELPQPGRLLRRAEDAEASATLLTRGRHGDAAALRELLAEHSDLPVAAEGARLLGEHHLERGEAEDAAFCWRLARRLDPAGQAALGTRLLGVRARPTCRPGRAGSLGLARPVRPPQLRWRRRLPGGAAGAPPSRALAADATQVYVTQGATLLALDRVDGRLRWSRSDRPAQLRAPPTPEDESLLVAHGRVLRRTRRWLCARVPDGGSPVWSWDLTALGEQDPLPSDAFVHVIADPAGFVLLAVHQGERVVAALSRDGKPRWRTRLWEAQEPVVHAIAPGAGQAAPGRASVSVGSPQRVRRDGRLAALGERVFLNADGLLAACGLQHGELIWLRERTFGPRNDTLQSLNVDLAANAFALEAIVASGHLLRLDPLTGRALASPGPPGEGLDNPIPVALDPAQQVWARVEAGEDAPGLLARAGLVSELPAAPVWPLRRLLGVLAIPGCDGLSFQGPGGEPLGAAPWPLGPGTLEVAAGALLVGDPTGLALFAPGPAPAAAEPPAGLDPEGWATRLDDPSWRVREAAQVALDAALRGPRGPEVGALLTRLVGAETTPEVRHVCSELLQVVRRSERWSRILPGAPAAIIQPLLARHPTPAQLMALFPHLEPSPAAAAGLRAELAETHDQDARWQLLLLLLQVDPLAQGSTLIVIRRTREPRVERAGADLLVSLACRGGPDRPLRKLLGRATMDPSSVPLRALTERADPALWKRLAPPVAQDMPQRVWRETFRLNPGPEPDRAAFLAELLPLLEGE